MDNTFISPTDLGGIDTTAISLMLIGAFISGCVAGALAVYIVAMFV